MLMAAAGVRGGRMTVGDFVLVNTYLIQLYMPLNFLGIGLSRDQAVADRHGADVQPVAGAGGVADRPARGRSRSAAATISFDNVSFGYDPRRPILKTCQLHRAGRAHGRHRRPERGGKSTISRLLFRFYDVTGGRVTIDGQDVRDVTQASLRARDRHRPAGHGAVQRHHLLQHRLWQIRRRPAPRSMRRPGSRASITSSIACPTAMRAGSASAASSCRAARSSGSRSPAPS